MIEVGRVVVKTCGRDAMKYGVVVEIVDDKYVLIDGNVRRKKVNMNHIEPISMKLDIKKGATTKDVLEAFGANGLEVTKSAESKPKKEKKPQARKEKKLKKTSSKKK